MPTRVNGDAATAASATLLDCVADEVLGAVSRYAEQVGLPQLFKATQVRSFTCTTSRSQCTGLQSMTAQPAQTPVLLDRDCAHVKQVPSC